MTVYDTYIINTRDDVIAACNQIIALYGHSGVGINTDVKKLAAYFEVVKGWGILTGTWTVNTITAISNLHTSTYGYGELFVGIVEPSNGIPYPTFFESRGYRAAIFDDGRVLVPAGYDPETIGGNSRAAPYAGCNNITEYWIPLDTPQYLNDQSHDIDMLLRKRVEKSATFDISIAMQYNASINMDILNQKDNLEFIPLDILLQKQIDATHNPDILMKKIIEKSATFDILSILRLPKAFVSDVLIQTFHDKSIWMDTNILFTNESSVSMGINIQGNIVYDILNNTARFSPQFPAIGLGYKKRPYPIFDSRVQEKK